MFSLSHVRPFYDPLDYGQPGFPVHGISQARVLEWGAIAFSRFSVWSMIKDSWCSVVDVLAAKVHRVCGRIQKLPNLE